MERKQPRLNNRDPAEAGYDLIGQIGSGGYGYVYLLRDLRAALGQEAWLAGKFIYRQIFGPSDDPASDAGYRRALEGLQNFRSVVGESPYLLRVFDLRERHDQGYFYYIMELADDIRSGRRIDPRTYQPRTLKNELEHEGMRKRLAAARCAETAITLARGLAILHEAGFTHRDVRPSNIIFVNGVPKLADIDLLAGHDPALPSYIPRHYAAPEGGHSRQADLFSFGKTLYEMCTGCAVKEFPALPSDIRHWDDHQLVLQLNKIIGKACARDPRRRYPSAEQMLKELERIH